MLRGGAGDDEGRRVVDLVGLLDKVHAYLSGGGLNQELQEFNVSIDIHSQPIQQLHLEMKAYGSYLTVSSVSFESLTLCYER